MCEPLEYGRHPNHTQRGQLVYASCTAPPARPGSRDRLPAPRSLAWLLPAAPALFASFGVTGISPATPLSDPSARPRLPTPVTSAHNSSWLSRPVSTVMSRTAPSFQRGSRPQSQRFSGSRAGEVRLGILFRGGGCSGGGHFTTGRCCTSKMAAPCIWRNCEVNS